MRSAGAAIKDCAGYEIRIPISIGMHIVISLILRAALILVIHVIHAIDVIHVILATLGFLTLLSLSRKHMSPVLMIAARPQVLFVAPKSGLTEE